MAQETEHCDQLMTVAVNQVKFAMSDCLRHAAADLNVPGDHASLSVIKDELKKRLIEAVNGW